MKTYKKDVVDSTDDDEHMIYVTVSPVPLFVKIVFFYSVHTPYSVGLYYEISLFCFFKSIIPMAILFRSVLGDLSFFVFFYSYKSTRRPTL